MSKKKKKLDITLPRDCYKYQTGVEQISEEMSRYENNSEIVGMVYGKQTGFLIKDATYYYKVVSSPDILFNANILKSVVMLSLKYGMVGLLFADKEEAVRKFNQMGHRIMSPYILKDQYMTVFSRELQFLIFSFLSKIGITEEQSIKFAEIFSHLIEYDNAYRLRLVDILSETNKELLKHPTREIKRLMKILASRELHSNKLVTRKFKLFGILLSILFIRKKYRKAFKEAIQETDFQNLQYDDSDLYWVCVREDHNFLGKKKGERLMFADNKGFEYPEDLTKIWSEE